MAKIYKIDTKQGPLYATQSDYNKLQAYTRILNNYERELVRKYGKDFNLLVKPAEYNKAMALHNLVDDTVQRIRLQQAILKAMLNR